MRWQVRSERTVYAGGWLDVAIADVRLPDGRQIDHHVIIYPYPAVGVVVVRPSDGAVLLLWRHRITTDSWSWEVPAGRMEEGETPEQAGERETLEETGWRPGPLRPLITYHPFNGTARQTFHILRCDAAEYVGEPVDAYESDRVEWVPAADLAGHIRAGRVNNGLSLTALLHHLAFPES